MRRRIPLTIPFGLALTLACEALLFTDVALQRRGALHVDPDIRAAVLAPADGFLAKLARFVAINFTALIWPAYIVLLEGVLTLQAGRSPVRARRHHFAMLSLASILIWCIFDAINFNRGMKAWDYLGIPPRFSDRAWGYLLAFACIVPGMLMSGQVLMNVGLFEKFRTKARRLPPGSATLVILVGAAMFIFPLVHANPIANLTLWTSLVFLLDPINLKLGRPSLLRDWMNGWYGRTAALFTGGLLCGFLWEFWNYWALAKWVYHLPFLGSLEHVRYFEMPVMGLLGFIPFGAECWVMWQAMRIAFDGLVEDLPDDRALL